MPQIKFWVENGVWGLLSFGKVDFLKTNNSNLGRQKGDGDHFKHTQLLEYIYDWIKWIYI